MNLSLHEKAKYCVNNCRTSDRQMVLVLEEIDIDKTYLAFGKSSLWRYCVETLGLTETETGKFISVMRKSVAIPEFKEAIQSGELSFGKGARITSVIRPENSSRWIENAKELTHREIEKEIAKENPNPAPKERIKPVNSEKCEFRVPISYSLEAKIRRALECSSLPNMEGLLEEMTDFYLKHKDKVAKAERIKAKPKNEKNKDVKAQPPKDSKSSGYIPADIQHEVRKRDKGECQFKDCKEKKWTETHHIVLQAKGGTHSLDNLITLCSRHHAALHMHNIHFRDNEKHL